MTDHEPFQREPQNPQDPQVVVFSPELLKLGGPPPSGPGGLPPGGGGRRRQRRGADGHELPVRHRRRGQGSGKGLPVVFPDGPGRPGGSLLAGGVLRQRLRRGAGTRTGPAACIRNPPPGTTPRLCATWACAMKAARGWKRTWKRPWSCTAGRRREAIPWAGATWA